MDTIVISNQHTTDVDMQAVYEDIIEQVTKPIVPVKYLQGTRYLVNPAGRFVVGGPHIPANYE